MAIATGGRDARYPNPVKIRGEIDGEGLDSDLGRCQCLRFPTTIDTDRKLTLDAEFRRSAPGPLVAGILASSGTFSDSNPRQALR